MLVIRTAAAGRGAAWLIEGFQYFSKSAITWLGVVFILLIIVIVSALLPMAGIVLQILTPVFMGGLMLGCKEADTPGGQLRLNHLFAGFSHHTGNLLLLGVLYTLGTVIIVALMVIMVIVVLGSMALLAAIMDGDTSLLLENLLAMLVVILIGMLLYLPLLMAFWFGPALVMLEGQTAIDAIKYSFIGCLKNIVPFLVYGIIALPLSFVATIPFMLGWFILVPMTIASFYIGYRDIYSTDNTPALIQQA
jgi:hypothetical protein